MKCPNCGSTAQVKILDVTEYSDGTIMIKCQCGCGHYWVTIAENLVNIAKKNPKKNEKNT